jgi:hypothetical protein
MSTQLKPTGIACTLSGLLLVTCQDLQGMYSLNPTTGETTLLVDAKVASKYEQTWSNPSRMALAACECCAYVTDYGDHCIRRVTLPKEWFVKRSAPRRVSYQPIPLELRLPELPNLLVPVPFTSAFASSQQSRVATDSCRC